MAKFKSIYLSITPNLGALWISYIKICHNLKTKSNHSIKESKSQNIHSLSHEQGTCAIASS